MKFFKYTNIKCKVYTLRSVNYYEFEDDEEIIMPFIT